MSTLNELYKQREEELRAHICTSFNPMPKIIQIWYDEDEDLLMSLVKFTKDDKKIHGGAIKNGTDWH